MEKLFLHICCGPCSIYPVELLKEKGYEITGMYYNPNIHPIDEHTRRWENLKIVSDKLHFDVIKSDDFRQEDWENFKGQQSERCEMCYRIRMEKIAQQAKERGFKYFTTTLLVSPYQKHELIADICYEMAKKYDVEFLYIDFRPGFRQGQQKAKEFGLYRQKYCGCILSKEYK